MEEPAYSAGASNCAHHFGRARADAIAGRFIDLIKGHASPVVRKIDGRWRTVQNSDVRAGRRHQVRFAVGPLFAISGHPYLHRTCPLLE